MKAKKPELLSPAGDLEKLKAAVNYGADAVYIGGMGYGLRAKAGNFSTNEMKEGVLFAHSHNRRVYVTANIFARNDDLTGFYAYIKELEEIGVDAVIVSDPGILTMVKEAAPGMEIHISTQANITNYKAALFWHGQGAKRVVLARELSLDEIKTISRNIPDDLEIECFVHGAMCISYSGRCYLSQYMTNRDANRGNCSQPCRWGYVLTEENREDGFFASEDEKGAYILNSKDMRMVGHVPELINAGISSFKIEGRMKTAYYVASTTKAYRMAIDDFIHDESKYLGNIGKYMEETEKSSHRQYYTGFYFGSSEGQNISSSSYVRNYDYSALVLGYDENTKMALVSQRNKFIAGDVLEVLRQDGECFTFTVTEMYDVNNEPITMACHPHQIIKLKIPQEVQEYNIFRLHKIH